MSLRGNTAEVAAHLKTEIQDRLAKGRRRDDRGNASAIWRTRPRSRLPCSSASRRQPSSRHAPALSRAPSAWSRWRSSAEPEGHRPSRRGAEGRDGEQPAGGAVRRTGRPAGGQHGLAVSIGRTWPRGRPSCSGWIPSCTSRCSGGRMTTCAAERADRVPASAGHCRTPGAMKSAAEKQKGRRETGGPQS